MDDWDFLCVPGLVVAYLEAFDEANKKVGASRNILKTEVIYYASPDEMLSNEAKWNLSRVRQLAAVSDAAHPGLILGVVTGPVADLAGQVQDKLKVVTAMRSKLAVAQDPQTEHVLNKDCLNVSSVNHILQVHGHVLATETTCLGAFDEGARREQERFFLGVTEESFVQAALGPGWRAWVADGYGHGQSGKHGHHASGPKSQGHGCGGSKRRLARTRPE